jgi:hypothetical protein
LSFEAFSTQLPPVEVSQQSTDLALAFSANTQALPQSTIFPSILLNHPEKLGVGTVWMLVGFHYRPKCA